MIGLVNRTSVAKRASEVKSKTHESSVGKVCSLAAQSVAQWARACFQVRPQWDVDKFIKEASRATAGDSSSDAEIRKFLFQGADTTSARPSPRLRAQGLALLRAQGPGLVTLPWCVRLLQMSLFVNASCCRTPPLTILTRHSSWRFKRAPNRCVTVLCLMLSSSW